MGTTAMHRAMLVAVAVVSSAAAAEAKQPSVEDTIARDPLLIFVAEGSPNSCGPGCNRWIAVEGKFDRNSLQRMRDFLSRGANKKMPMYFHSEGGWSNEALEIGRLLRASGVTAGIGRTALQRCAGAANSPDCRRLLDTNKEQTAQLRLDQGMCNSACFYAFIGASHRTVDPRARIGIHGSGLPYLRDGSIAKIDRDAWYERRRREISGYVVQMGVDPGVVELAFKIPQPSLHILTRAELERFGVISKDRFETSWTGREGGLGDYILSKSVVSRSPDHDNIYLTTMVGLACHRYDRVTVFIEREMAANETGNEPIIHVVGDDVAVWTSSKRMSGIDHVDYRAQVMSFDEALKVLPKRSFELKLEYASPEWTGRSGTIKLSIAGLEKELTLMRKRCEKFR